MPDRALRAEGRPGTAASPEEVLWVEQPTTHEGGVQVAQRLGCQPEELWDFASNINPLGAPPALRQLWRPAEVWRLLQVVQRYPDPECQLLRQAIAAELAVAVAGVIPASSTLELLSWAVQEMGALGVERVLTLAPHSYCWCQVLQGAGRSPLYLPGLWASEDVILSKVEALAAGQQFGLMVSNPHNPTGQLYSRQLWEQVLSLPNCALLVVDESLMDFCEPGASLLPAVANHPNLVVWRSLSNFYAIPGLRVGFMVVAGEQGHRWGTRRLPWNINGIAEQAALACLQDRKYQAAVRLWLPPARDRLYRELQQIPGLTPYSSAAPFLLVRCRSRAQAWQEFLLHRHRILVKEGRGFVGLDDRHLRIAVRSFSDQDRLLAALQAAQLE
ncbi:MAG: pyridoxal phosphate-dependent aminotransferase [Pseudanabaenaceae cyanobacterium]